MAEPGTLFPPSSIQIQTLRDVPYAIVTLLCYEYLRDNWIKKRPRAAWRDMVVGGIAGGIGSYVTNPLDVIKTRLQTGYCVSSGATSSRILECAMQTWTEEGVNGFLKGSVPRLIHKVPANALFFVFYEFIRSIMGLELLNE